MIDAAPAVAGVGALGTACALYATSALRGRARFALALCAGAALAYLGPSLLYGGEPPGARGASLLFVPLGVLWLAPWREALAALPLAFAVARLGCLPSGCCYPGGWSALPEILALLGLHGAARRWPRETVPIVLSGFGLLRLLVLPLRNPPSAALRVDPAWLAAGWLLAGVALRSRLAPAPARPREAPATSCSREAPATSCPAVCRLRRALALMLALWAWVPLAGWWLGDGPAATALASAAALGLALAVLRPGGPARPRRAVGALGLGLLAGLGLACGLVPAPPSSPPPLAGLALGVLAPVAEELLYRGPLLGALRDLWGAPVAWLASSALFALAHADLRTAPVAFAGGLVCAGVVLRTGSLAAALGLHVGWNLGVLA